MIHSLPHKDRQCWTLLVQHCNLEKWSDTNSEKSQCRWYKISTFWNTAQSNEFKDRNYFKNQLESLCIKS